ncbi:MAG: Cna domain protein [Phycisphaerales bacterium]|nr:Cna domain protein [Phycisphaerales bacterium]
MQMLTRANQSVVEHLESRTLLSAGGTLNPSFGNGGILTGYEVLGVRPDGYLIATRPNGPAALLHPDGSFAANYTGAVPAPLNSMQGGTPEPPPLAVAGGKHLVLHNSVLTRYNSNGAVDTTFGNNGSVSDFISGTSELAFKAYTMVLKGTEVFVVGEATFRNNDTNMVAVGVAAIDGNGHRVASFGSHGLALDSNGVLGVGPSFGQINVAELGPDGKLYVGADQDEDPYLFRFDTTTGNNDAQSSFLSYGFDPGLTGFTFQHDRKILVLTHEGGPLLHLYRLNTNFTADTSFGNQGDVQVISPHGLYEPDSAQADALLVRADGTIFVSGIFADPSQPIGDSYLTFAYRPGTPAGSGAISGHFFNDLNGNGKRETNEPALRYWAAYADLNNDGIWEQGEPIAYADYNGYFKIDGLAAGKYAIREIRQAGWTRTTPAGIWPAGAYTVTLAPNQLVGYRDFGDKFTG